MKTGKILVLATARASRAANAAILLDIQGDVRVGRDKGFARVQGSAEGLPGDKIKVGRKRAARILYPEGCSAPVDANSLARIAAHSPSALKALASLPSHKGPDYIPLAQDRDPGIPCDPFPQDTVSEAQGNRDRWLAGFALPGFAGAAAGLGFGEGCYSTPRHPLPPATP
jgi:hypothetical protein